MGEIANNSFGHGCVGWLAEHKLGVIAGVAAAVFLAWRLEVRFDDGREASHVMDMHVKSTEPH